MSSLPNCYRVVIQYAPEPTDSPPYILTAYQPGVGQPLAPARYNSLQDLMERFLAAGIVFPQEKLTTKDPNGAYIVFTGEIEMNDAQLAILGLKF